MGNSFEPRGDMKLPGVTALGRFAPWLPTLTGVRGASGDEQEGADVGDVE